MTLERKVELLLIYQYLDKNPIIHMNLDDELQNKKEELEAEFVDQFIKYKNYPI